MNDILKQAARTPHINGILLNHLQGTRDLLTRWGNREALCQAGLYHSVYSTEDFKSAITTSRDELREIINQEAEQIVFDFSTCDRDHFYQQLDHSVIHHRNRNSGEIKIIENSHLCDLLELTLANELEILFVDPNLIQIYRKRDWEARFNKFRPYVSQAGFKEYQRLFEEKK